MARVTGDLLVRHFGGYFCWGVRDCCISACNAFRDLHGIDPMAPFRGRYGSEAEARAILRESGGLVLLTALMCRQAGLEWRHPEFCRPGDLAVLHFDDQVALGLAIEPGRFAAKTARGMGVLSDAEGCWGPT